MVNLVAWPWSFWLGDGSFGGSFGGATRGPLINPFDPCKLVKPLIARVPLNMSDKPLLPRAKLYESLAGDNPEVFKASVASDVSSAYREAIGEIAILWSLFEATVDMGTLHFGNIPLVRGFCLTSQISGIGRKLDAFISMAKLEPIPKHILTEFNKFSKKARGIAEMRNRIIHDPWLTADSGALNRLEITARQELRLKLIPTELNELQDFIQSISRAECRI